MAKKIKLKARFDQVLLYADGPQVVMLSAPADSKIIGVAVNRPGHALAFYAAQISIDQLRDYLKEKFDLRYLLLKPDFRRNFFFDLSTMLDGVVELERVRFSPEEAEKFVPEPGIFSRDHTDALVVELAQPQAAQTYGIDGKWDVPEVSRFYGQVTDLYAMFNSIDAFLDEQVAIDQKMKVREAFSKPFQGGGSYLSLYDSLESAALRGSELHLDAMAYNSPGYVRVKGMPRPLAEIRQLIEHFGENTEAVGKKYRALHKFLSENKLLRMPSDRYVSAHPLHAEVQLKTRELTDVLDAISYEDTMKVVGQNALIAAKVTLSIYRRVLRLHEFFLQGRASFDVATSQT